jgi:hypothetical protein
MHSGFLCIGIPDFSFFLLAQSDNIGGTGYIILVASRNATLSYVAVYLAAW